MRMGAGDPDQVIEKQIVRAEQFTIAYPSLAQSQEETPGVPLKVTTPA